jgi:hypothetical protein
MAASEWLDHSVWRVIVFGSKAEIRRPSLANASRQSAALALIPFLNLGGLSCLHRWCAQEALMRMHSILPWPPITLRPLRKQENTKRSKATEQSLASFGVEPRRVPPSHAEQEGDDAPGENVDIVV